MHPNWPPRWTRSAMLRYDPTRMDSMFHGSGFLSCGFAFAERLPDPAPRTGLAPCPASPSPHFSLGRLSASKAHGFHEVDRDVDDRANCGLRWPRPRGSFGPVYTQACARARAPSTVVPRAACGAPMLSVASTRTPPLREGPKSSAIITAPDEKLSWTLQVHPGGMKIVRSEPTRHDGHNRGSLIADSVPTATARYCRPYRSDRTGKGLFVCPPVDMPALSQQMRASRSWPIPCQICLS